MPTQVQEVLQVIPDPQKIQMLPPGVNVLASWQAQGYAQLIGTLSNFGALPITRNVEISAMPGTAPWLPIESKVVPPGAVADEFVVDMTGDFVRIVLINPNPVPSLIVISANLWPIAALESNRSAAAPDVVWVKRGDNGAYGAVAVPAPPAAPVLLSAANPNRLAVTFRNMGNRNVAWGWDNLVTMLTGFPLRPVEAFTVRDTTKDIWAITTAGVPATVDVRVIEELK